MLFIYGAIQFRRGNMKYINIAKKILCIPLSICGNAIFIPTIEIFVSVLYCNKKTLMNEYLPTYSCDYDKLYIPFFSGIFTFVFYIITTVLIMSINLDIKTNSNLPSG